MRWEAPHLGTLVHPNRDFRDFRATTPGDYLARRLLDGGGVTINSFQDEGTRRS